MKKELIGVLNGIVKSVILILMDFLSKDKKIILQVKNVLINKKYLILKTNLMKVFLNKILEYFIVMILRNNNNILLEVRNDI